MLNLQAKEVQRFWRAAQQHFVVARRLADFGGDKVLRSAEAYHAVYIGGYAVECGLKALYLSRVTPKRHVAEIDVRFKDLGHNLAGLAESIATRFGVVMPRDVLGNFRKRVATKDNWDVGMRYFAGLRSKRSAMEFLDTVRVVLRWIEGDADA